MPKILNVLRTEPALILALAQALLSLLVGAGLNLTPTQTGAILAVVSAASGLVVAIAVKEIAAPVLVGFSTAVGTLLITFNVPHVSSGLVSAVNGVIVALVALILRGNVTTIARKTLTR